MGYRFEKVERPSYNPATTSYSDASSRRYYRVTHLRWFHPPRITTVYTGYGDMQPVYLSACDLEASFWLTSALHRWLKNAEKRHKREARRNAWAEVTVPKATVEKLSSPR